MHIKNEKERTLALRDALVAKGLLLRADIDAMEEGFETWTPANGAAIVARAWCDPAFRQRLLDNALTASAEVCQTAAFGWDLVALENTNEVHNVLVCSLCSCTFKPLIGTPPVWYKSLAYRARLVREPRSVLKELGLELETDITIKVWDITAETGYIVIPERPAGTEGWSEKELASIITKKCLIGAALPDVNAVVRDGILADQISKSKSETEYV